MSIELKNVSYIYEAGTAMAVYGLQNVSLTVNEGEILAVIGHTGSGKSTMIQLMNGLLKPSSGQVLYNGEDIFGEKYDRRALRGKVGLVFQYPEYQLFEVDVLTDVCFGPKNQGLPEEERLVRAKEALAAVGLGEEYYTRSPFELSGGEKRRAAIAGVLAMQPRILILDEPTAGLDPQGREDLLTMLRDLRASEGMGIVIVSHSMDDVAALADRIAVLSGGEKRMEGTPREIFRDQALLEELGLDAPVMTRILRRLGELGMPVEDVALSVPETEEAIMKLFAGGPADV